MASPALPSRRIMLMLLATAIVLMTMDGRDAGPIRGIRGAVIGATEPLRAVIGWAFSPIGDTWTGAVHYDNVVEENAELRARVAELEGSIAQLPDLETELAQLKEATSLGFGEGLPVVAAEVVEDRDTGVERIIEINKGSADGIKPSMAVVTGSGLVGRVIQVNSDHRSVVRLITDGRVRVGVLLTRTGGQGVASGLGSHRPLDVDFTVEASSEVGEGDLLRTTGFASSKYPGDIPVGRVIIDESGRTQIEVAADLERLVFVTVILDVPENP